METMKTVHQLLLSDEYIAESQRVQIAQNRTLRFFYQTWWVWWIPRIILVGIIAFCLAIQLRWDAGLIGGFLLFTFVGEHFGKRSLAKARSRMRAKGTTTTVSMDENGIDIASALGNSHLKWEALQLPVVKADGVLLKVTSAGGLWLPDRALVEGTPNDVRHLMSVKVGAPSCGR
jgi:hypothetical protein